MEEEDEEGGRWNVKTFWGTEIRSQLRLICIAISRQTVLDERLPPLHIYVIQLIMPNISYFGRQGHQNPILFHGFLVMENADEMSLGYGEEVEHPALLRDLVFHAICS